MPCINGPAVTAPTLPDPLSLTAPSVAGPAGDLNLCCKLPPFPIPIPPIPIPAVIMNSAVVAAVNTFIGQVVTFVSSLSVPCPRE